MQVPSLSFLGFLLVTLVLCLSVGRGSRQAGRKVLALAGVVFTVLGLSLIHISEPTRPY